MNRISLIAAAASMLAVSPAAAGVFETNSGGFWHQASIWNLTSGVDAGGDGIPSAGDSAVIKGFHFVEMHTPCTADALRVEGELSASTVVTVFNLTHTFGSVNIASNGLFELADGREAEVITTIVNGDFTIENGGKLQGARFGSSSTIILQVGGNFINQSTGGFSVINGAANSWTIDFIGATTSNMTIAAGLTSVNFGNIVVEPGHTLNMDSAVQMYITAGNGVTVNTNGVLNLSPATFFTGPGNFTLLTGSTLGLGGVDGVKRSSLFQNLGTTTLPADANYAFFGTGGQNLGPDIPATVNGLTIDTADGGAILAGPVTITGALTLNGKLSLNSFALTHSGAGSGPAGTGWIITDNGGSVIRPSSASLPYVFKVGATSSSESPLLVTSAGGHVADSLAVKVEAGTIPGSAIDSSKVVNRSWTITEGTPGGSNLDLGFIWAGADAGGSITPGSAVAWRHDGSRWQPQAGGTAGAGPFSTTTTGVTQLSPWTVGEPAGLPVSISAFSTE